MEISAVLLKKPTDRWTSKTPPWDDTCPVLSDTEGAGSKTYKIGISNIKTMKFLKVLACRRSSDSYQLSPIIFIATAVLILFIKKYKESAITA